MSESPVVRKAITQAQSTGSGHTQMTSRPLHITEPTASKRVCFYKSGDSQFSGLPVVISSRTFKTFDALLDSLSKRVPLPFGVRTITTPHGHTAVQSLDQLHHGHSYICSDRRTVKPIDFERAHRKLPPWYHARPVSARCLAWYTHSSAQHGTCSARRNEHAILLHTPKRLVLFRNGEPEVKHTLMLQRRTTYSFEALLDHISEVMHFPVLKLLTPNGRRVDGLPALILCSGVLVAAGREPFKKRNYDVQKSSPPTWLPVKRLGRRPPIARKKKSSSTKSRPFSPSSEHYFVNQIQNSMSGSMCDFPSNPNGSVEVEPALHLESVAETEIITSRDGEKEDDTQMPSNDDIEKSFRVNQDGSMTVEMKVCLTIKEEETIHWTTTVSRSSVYNQFKAATISCPDLDANLPDNLPRHSDTLTVEVRESDPNDSNHFFPEDGCMVNEETEISGGAASMELEWLPSPLSHFPELHKVQHKQGSTESIKTVGNTEIHENHSYSSMEELDSGEVKQEYCMVQHCNHPVPKPRCTLASEIHTTTQLQLSNYRCSENLQFQDNQKKMCETPSHIYEKQTCQENCNTQLHLQDMDSSAFGPPHDYIASSDTTFPASSDEIFHSFKEDIKSENLATIKCQSVGKQGTLSPISKLYASTDKTNTTSTKRAKVAVTPVIASSKASVSKGVLTPGTTIRRKPVRVIVKKNHLFRSAIPKRKQRPNKADILKELKKKRRDILSQKGAMKLNEHFRAQKLLKRRNNNGNVPLKPQTEQLECIQLKTNDLSPFWVEKDQNNTQVQAGSYTLPRTKMQNASLIKGTLGWQTSEYVELWLQRSKKVKPSLLNQPSLETIPKNNTMAKASLFNYQSVNSMQPSTKEAFEEKVICAYSPKTKKLEQINSDHLTKTRENQLTSEIISKTNSYDTENTLLRRPLDIQTRPPIELIDFQAQKFYTVKMAVRPDMKPVLEQLCYYIQSLQLSLKMSKCLPDFSSHVESTFSSSSRVLLAFLSVMTLRDGLRYLHACGQADASLSCSEAMLMLQSLKELAEIEDAEHLRISLSDLYNSASVQLLQSWKGFQVLINKARCSSATPETSVSESHQSPSSEEEEHAIQVLIEHLGVPERVREELAALNHLDENMICNQIEDTDKVSDSFPAMKMNGFSELHSKEKMASFSDFVLEDYVNIYVNSVIDRAITAHLKDSNISQVFIVGSLERPEKDFVIGDRYQQDLRNVSRACKNVQGHAIPVSDICKDMPSVESSFGAEMYRELEKVGHKRQEEKTFKKHLEKAEEMREERQREITEERGTSKENSSTWEKNSKSLKTVLKKEELLEKVVNEIEKDRDTVEEEGSKLSESLVTCIGKLHFSAKEKVNQQEEDGSYNDEIFPKQRYFSKEKNLSVKSPGQIDKVEQICSKETISKHWQNEFQFIQTQDQLHNKAKSTERDIVLPEVQGILHSNIESNIEVDEIQHSITHQDFCMESRTYSEEEHVILEAPECYTIYQENCVEIPEETIEYEVNEKHFKEEIASTVAKPVSSLQDQGKSVGKGPYNTEQTTGKRLLNHISATNLETSTIIKNTESGSMDPVSSSLAFSYDSKNSDLAKDPEVHIQTNRVKSIRDMFLAKSNADMRHGQAQLSSPSSELSELESSHRKEYQLLTSSEVSREEKNTCRLSIAKGYVQRTIEQLYGKGSKGCSSDEKRSPSTDKVEKREGVHTNAIPDLSYFNATSSVDSSSEPMNCVTLNTRVGPKDAVSIDKGRWLLRENQLSLKSCSENEDTSKHIKNKDVLAESERDSGKEDIPYSLFGHSPMMPDKDPSFTEQEEECPGRTIIYFHLPNANDSEVQPGEQKTDTPKSKTVNQVTPLIEPPKCLAEKHSFATFFTPMDIIKAANKVHPMTETTPPVIAQPTKGQSAGVTRHSADPDALEILYMFCGQHCPIL